MTKKRNSYARFSKEEILENIKIVEKNIENARNGRSSEFDLDELEEELEYFQECLDY